MRERRKSVRVDVYARGTIGFRGRYRMRCLVQNLSASGAKLVLEKPTDLPEQFVLRLSHRGVSAVYEVTVKWRSRAVVGVEFTDALRPAAEPVLGLSAA